MSDIMSFINRMTGVNYNPGVSRSMARSIARGMIDRIRGANPGVRNIGATFD